MPAYEYECHNPECAAIMEIRHSIKDPAMSLCPLCHQTTLKRNIVNTFLVFIDMKKPKSLGGIAEQNTTAALRRGETPPGWEKKPTPIWRDGPIDMKILRNPKKFIETGKV